MEQKAPDALDALDAQWPEPGTLHAGALDAGACAMRSIACARLPVRTMAGDRCAAGPHNGR
jgi:hypothetical protein